MNLGQRLRDLLAYEPAVVAWATNGGLAILLAFVFHLGGTQGAAVTTLATALAAAYTAWRARPVAVSALGGALVTGVTAASAFGLHLPATVIAATVGLLSNVLALVFRANLTPTITLAAQLEAANAASGKTLVTYTVTGANVNPTETTINVATPVTSSPGVVTPPSVEPR